MWFSRRGVLFAGVGVFLMGVILFLAQKPFALQPPVLSERSAKTQTQVHNPTPSAEMLSGPWFRTPPRVAASPPPKPQTAPVPTDKTSVAFLGSSKDSNGEPTYFFKYLPSGQALVLRQGETRKGWTLESVSDTKFILSGSGGRYEVTR